MLSSLIHILNCGRKYFISWHTTLGMIFLVFSLWAFVGTCCYWCCPQQGEILARLLQEDRRPGACWSFCVAQRMEREKGLSGVFFWVRFRWYSLWLVLFICGSHVYLFVHVFTSLFIDFEISFQFRRQLIVLPMSVSICCHSVRYFSMLAFI